ncbi:hypothetical protein RE628_21570 [Paenibacillus sp. D2_2]|nr:hypothetical protein [Paenibacillus sp. D2_2]WMT39915.1 hypothetical protein RE628_21570 [Paenibacillus sp. D2_2]
MLDTVSIHSGVIDAQPETLGLDQNRLTELTGIFPVSLRQGSSREPVI